MLETYLYLDSRKGDDFSQSLQKVRAMQRQLEHLSRKEREDDLARKPQGDKVVYSEFFELCRELKWEVSKMNGASQARSCINLFATAVSCGKPWVNERTYYTPNLPKPV